MIKKNDKFSQKIRDNYDLYKEIDSDEPRRPFSVMAIVRAVAPLGPTAAITVTAIIVLGIQGMSGQPDLRRDGMLTTVAVFGVLMARERGAYVKASKQGSKGTAQPGAARASPRKARARPGAERGG